jgi:hypothetical protein
VCVPTHAALVNPWIFGTHQVDSWLPGAWWILVDPGAGGSMWEGEPTRWAGYGGVGSVDPGDLVGLMDPESPLGVVCGIHPEMTGDLVDPWLPGTWCHYL